MNLLKPLVALVFISMSALALANNNQLRVAESTGPFTSSAEEKALTQKAINVLKSDEKIKGVITVETHGDTVNLAGQVATVAMVYRSVEVLRDQGLENVNVERLETD